MSILLDDLPRLMFLTYVAFLIGNFSFQAITGKNDWSRVASQVWDMAVAFAVLYLVIKHNVTP